MEVSKKKGGHGADGGYTYIYTHNDSGGYF